MTVIRFNDLTRQGSGEFKGPRTPVGGMIKENGEGVSQRLRVWNHLCLIHLQYVPQVFSISCLLSAGSAFRVMLSWSMQGEISVILSLDILPFFTFIGLQYVVVGTSDFFFVVIQ